MLAVHSNYRSAKRMNIKLLNRSTQFLALFCLLSVIVAGCSNSPAPVAPADVSATSAYWPTEAWRASTPEAQGMDSQRLAGMVAEIRARKMRVHSLLVIRNGYLVSETYFEDFQPDTRHHLQSVTKSFISTLIGIAIDQGYLKGTDQRVVGLFPESAIANLDNRKQAMTLADLLTMRSGLNCQEGDIDYQAILRSPDGAKYMLDKPMIEAPGSRWNYCSGGYHVLSAIIQQTTGKNARDFAEQNLFKPLGISNVVWPTDKAGISTGGAGLQLTPRDMAKLGYLYLRGGQWAGQQIVSSEWVQAATQKYADVDEHFGYGYHWFTVSSMAGYASLGSYGQIILVIPESDLVIVTTANTEESIFELIEQYVLPSVQKAS
jgi:CubicO group peptidase (beta-lactamase class C family)